MHKMKINYEKYLTYLRSNVQIQENQKKQLKA